MSSFILTQLYFFKICHFRYYNIWLCFRPELEASLNEYRVEAAWRLGKWDCLEKYLETNPNQNSWGSGVGQVLLAVRARDSAAYQSSLRRLRTQQIAPLSAASMEKWAYQRAYPNILRSESNYDFCKWTLTSEDRISRAIWYM